MLLSLTIEGYKYLLLVKSCIWLCCVFINDGT